MLDLTASAAPSDTQRARAIATDIAGRIAGDADKTLIVVGSQDRQEVIVHGATLSREISTADIRVMQESGHLMSMEAPDEFNHLALSFMAEHEE